MTIIKLICSKIQRTLKFLRRKDINLEDVYALKSGLVKTGVSFGTPDYKALHYLLHEFTRLKHIPSIEVINRNLSIEIKFTWQKGTDKYFVLISIIKFSVQKTDNRYSTLSNFEIGSNKSHVMDNDSNRIYSHWGDCNLIAELADNLNASVNDFMKNRR